MTIRTITVSLGGQTYEIQPLPIRKSRAWREKLQGPFTQLVDVLASASKIELTDGAQLGRLISIVQSTLLGSVDLVLDLLFDYSPALQADRERIEEYATDDEALDAFLEVLKLAYPFGGFLEKMRGSLSPGSASPRTRQS